MKKSPGEKFRVLWGTRGACSVCDCDVLLFLHCQICVFGSSWKLFHSFSILSVVSSQLYFYCWSSMLSGMWDTFPGWTNWLNLSSSLEISCYWGASMDIKTGWLGQCPLLVYTKLNKLSRVYPVWSDLFCFIMLLLFHLVCNFKYL